MKLYAVVTENGGMNYAGGSLNQRNSYLASLKPGTLLEVEIKPHRPKKTARQCRAYFGVLIRRVKEYLDDNGQTVTLMGLDVPWTAELIKEWFYAACDPRDDDGEKLTISKMDTVQMVRFFDECRDAVARTWGLPVPDPDPNYR